MDPLVADSEDYSDPEPDSNPGSSGGDGDDDKKRKEHNRSPPAPAKRLLLLLLQNNKVRAWTRGKSLDEKGEE